MYSLARKLFIRLFLSQHSHQNEGNLLLTLFRRMWVFSVRFYPLLISRPRLARSLFFVVDSVCLLLRLSVCLSHAPSNCFFFVSRWNRTIFLAVSSPCGTLQNVILRFLILKKVKERIAVSGIPSHSYGTSLAIWDHTVLPATRHK